MGRRRLGSSWIPKGMLHAQAKSEDSRPPPVKKAKPRAAFRERGSGDGPTGWLGTCPNGLQEEIRRAPRGATVPLHVGGGRFPCGFAAFPLSNPLGDDLEQLAGAPA